MTSIVFAFEVHQPRRIAVFQPNGNITNRNLEDYYFNNGLDKWVFQKVSNKCYLPATQILLELIDNLKHEKRPFKVSFSLSGVFVEMAEKYNKDVLEFFKQLVETGMVELIGETYYHSLASIFEPPQQEFKEQVMMHKNLMKEVFGKEPKVFMNTEMIYNNVIAKRVEELGFKGIFCEGAERVLGWRSPNYIYVRKFAFPNDPPPKKRIRVLLRNYRLSDDIGYRFSARDWDQWPLTADKYAAWLNATPGQVINIYMDYETFGEHQWADTGIFWFLKALPYEILKYENLEFATPSEVIEKYEPVGEIDVFEFSTASWADMERDLSAWIGNKMQMVCFEELKNLEKYVKKLNDPYFLKIWRYLQISDHLYYICTKWWNDGDVHKYFSSFPTPQDAFVNLISIISDFKARVLSELAKKGK